MIPRAASVPVWVRATSREWLTWPFNQRPKPAAPGASLADERERVISALLNATADLSYDDDPEATIKGICESVVNASPRIRLAWAWFGPRGTDVIIPKVYAGPASGYAAALTILKTHLTERGPAFGALLSLRADTTVISRVSLFAPWRAAALEYGFESVAAFPLRAHDAHERGVLIIYADARNFFKHIGLDPFRALVRLAEGSLNRAALCRQLQDQTQTDPLTGLCSRPFLARELARLRAEAGRCHAAIALIKIDIDDFHRINDQHGLHTGDMVLVRLAAILRRTLRDDDLVVRWGGDVFLCCMLHNAMDDCAALAQRIRIAANASRTECPDSNMAWSVSIGLAAAASLREPFEITLRRADAALHAAKTGGGNQLSIAAAPVAA